MYLGMYVVPTGIVCFLHNTTVLILKFWKFAKSLRSLGLRCREREMLGEAKEACIKKRHTMWSLRVILLKGKPIFAPGPSDGTLFLVPRRAFLFPHHVFPSASSLSLPCGLYFLSSLTPNVYCYNINTIADHLTLCLKFSISLVHHCISSFWKSPFLARQFLVAINCYKCLITIFFSFLVQNKSHFIQETPVCIIHNNRDRRYNPSVGHPQLKKAIY